MEEVRTHLEKVQTGRDEVLTALPFPISGQGALGARTHAVLSSDYRLAIAIVFIAGLAAQVFLEIRGWLQDDQLALLSIGMDFATTGHLDPVAKTMTGGGWIPGSLLQLLSGVPLMLWMNFKSPTILVGLFHLAGGIVLYRVFMDAIGPRFTLFFLAVYWLSPWRLFNAGFAWEHSYVFLPAALHCWACWKLRDQARMLPSAVLGAVLVLSFQIHGSFLILVAAALLLFMMRLIRVHGAGLLLGSCIGALPLIPTFIALLNGTLPSILPSHDTFGMAFGKPYLLGKVVWDWLRLSTPDLGRQISSNVFFKDDFLRDLPFGQGIIGLAWVLFILAGLSAFLSAAVLWWYVRSYHAPADHVSGRSWLRNYALVTMLAVFICAGLSPVFLNLRHLVIALHVACIPVATWLDSNWPFRQRWVRIIAILFIVLRLPVVTIAGFGNTMYREGTIQDFHRYTVSRKTLSLIPDGAWHGSVRDTEPDP